VLSTRREAITAKGAHDAYVEEGGQSVGTWGVTVQEVHDAGLEPFDDEYINNNPPYHATIWFPDKLTRGQQERYARALHKSAKQRGKTAGCTARSRVRRVAAVRRSRLLPLQWVRAVSAACYGLEPTLCGF
jgi:hypothetical protein